ncbi:unnamed protein product [Rodentolepis nana]|uniref:Uncharacterized protein n=1 Tax=Rodentolepis nana TaxID=102285 RepID=A0A0R3TUK9_RODNA|nr:unnamed protein product [Rodentolepis nana]
MMSGSSNSLNVFGRNDLIQRNVALINAEEKKEGNNLLFSRGKRPADGSEDLEEITLQCKRPATEEMVLRRLSNLNISNVDIGKPTDDADMFTIEDLSDDESSNEVNDDKCFILPEALKKDYELIQIRGSLHNPFLMKLASSSLINAVPETCLALVPYVPRPVLPPLAYKQEEDIKNVNEDCGNEKSVGVEPMDFAPENFTNFNVLPSTVSQSLPSFSFNSGFSFGQIDV